MNARKLKDLSKDELIELIRHERGEPEYRISACYFPKAGEVELSWERQHDGAEAHLTFKATPDQGKRLASVIDPCVYHTAAPQPDTSMTLRDYFAAQVIGPAFLDLFTGWRQRGEMVYEDWPMGLAIDAYRVADAMLKARESKS